MMTLERFRFTKQLRAGIWAITSTSMVRQPFPRFGR